MSKKLDKEVVFQYRCRRCGELFDSSIETSAENADFTLIRSVHPFVGMQLGDTAPLMEIHNDQRCVAHGITGKGVGDLAGYRVKG